MLNKEKFKKLIEKIIDAADKNIFCKTGLNIIDEGYIEFEIIRFELDAKGKIIGGWVNFNFPKTKKILTYFVGYKSREYSISRYLFYEIIDSGNYGGVILIIKDETFFWDKETLKEFQNLVEWEGTKENMWAVLFKKFKETGITPKPFKEFILTKAIKNKS